MINLICFISGCIIGFFFGSFIVTRYFNKKLNNTNFSEALNNSMVFVKENMQKVNEVASNLKAEIDKKHMEEDLRLKLETEEKLKKIDDETLEKLRNINIDKK